MTQSVCIVLLRNELRLTDHPALLHAAKHSAVIPVFVLDDKVKLGGASLWWLHHSLNSLGNDFAKHGIKLILRRGDTQKIIEEIQNKTNAKAIYCTRSYTKHDVRLEKSLHEKYQNTEIEFRRFGGNLLIEPEKITNKQGTAFQVFTPFFKALQQSNHIRTPFAKPDKIIPFAGEIQSDNLDDWGLLPTKPNWAEGFAEWEIGEAAAFQKLEKFLNSKINIYSEGRDFPALAATSLLSPHLRFGEISPAQIWDIVNLKCHGAPIGNYQKFLSELAWREFSYHLLIAYPDMATKPIKQQFSAIEWDNDENLLIAWQSGQTGFPIIDAGMRELWQTGYMHNRVRMIVASFLVKDLLIDWQYGEQWFWDCLLDADYANNPASWQWVAGCGMDAAPYFRIFNPTTQSQKFDADGKYIKRWLPELVNLPNKYIHEPSTAPKEILLNAGIIMGKTYPLPIVNHKTAREKTLFAYGKIKGAE